MPPRCSSSPQEIWSSLLVCILLYEGQTPITTRFLSTCILSQGGFFLIYVLAIASVYISKIVFDRIPSLPNQTRKLLFVTTSFSVLFLICALRCVTVGTDMVSYMGKFALLRDYSFGDIFSGFYSERVEIGFALLNKLLGLVFTNPHCIIIASAFLFCVGMGVFVYRYIDDALTAVILFTCCGVYLYAFNIIRQMIACALLMNAWGLLTRKRYTWSFVLFIVSMTFHVTSLVFIIVYLFYFLRNNKKAVTITLAVGSLLAVNYRGLIKLASLFINSFSYLNNSKQKLTPGGIWLVWFIEIALVLLYLTYYYFSEKPPARRLLRKLPHPLGYIDNTESLCIPVFSALYVVFSVMGASFNYMDRFGTYFLPFCIPLFINFGKRIQQQSPPLYRFYLVGLHTCFVAYFLFFASNLEHYRYASMWS